MRLSSAQTSAEQLRSKSNYFVRHWRGELTLAQSYWLNGALASVFAFFLTLGVATGLGRLEYNYIQAITWSLIWLIATVIVVWQVVGVWRSAGHRKEPGQRDLWGSLARVTAVLVVVLIVSIFWVSGLPMIRKSVELGDWLENNAKCHFQLSENGTELEMSGGIGYGTASQLKQLLDTVPNIQVIHIDANRGGLTSEARLVRDLIRSKRLDTYVSTNCVSACAIVYMGGLKRCLKSGARIGFHAPWALGFAGKNEQEMLTHEREYLVSIGVSPWFVDKVMLTSPKRMWYPTVKELIDAGVVTVSLCQGQEIQSDRKP